jgi:hypothetical protein
MPTTIITGRDITFTIDGDDFDAQATSATLTVDSTINTYQTLDGKAYFTTDTQGSFAVEMLADWGAASSLCEALWTAATSAPNTGLASGIGCRHRCIICIRCPANLAISRRHCARCPDHLTCLYLRDHASINNQLKGDREHETTNHNRIHSRE